MYALIFVRQKYLLMKSLNLDKIIGKFEGKFGPRNSKLSVLPKNWGTWYLEDVDSYSNVTFLNLQP